MIKLFRLIFKAVPKIIHAYFSWIHRYYKHKDDYPLSLRFYKVQHLIKDVYDLFKVDFHSTDLEKLYQSEKKNLIICNHQSMFDVVQMMALAKRPMTFVCKIEVEKFIFVGKIVHIIDGEFLDRDNLKQQVKVILKVEKLLVEQKYDVVIYPEGTRNKTIEKGLLEFHPGTFKIATKAKCDIVIVENWGTYRCLQLLKYKKSHQPIQFEYLTTLKYENIKDLNTSEISTKCFEIMSNNYFKLMENDLKFKY